MVSLRIASAGKETGALLTEMLSTKGIYDPKSKKVVSYGVHVKGAFNENAGRGKERAMTLMRSAGVRTVPFWLSTELSEMSVAQLETLTYPMFGRMFHGYGAKD